MFRFKISTEKHVSKNTAKCVGVSVVDFPLLPLASRIVCHYTILQ